MRPTLRHALQRRSRETLRLLTTDEAQPARTLEVLDLAAEVLGTLQPHPLETAHIVAAATREIKKRPPPLRHPPEGHSSKEAPLTAPKPLDETRLRELADQGWTDGRIGEALGASASAVRRARQRLGLEAQPRHRPPKGPPRTKAFILRLTEEQLGQLHTRAGAAGVSAQDYVHGRLFPDSVG